MSPELPKTGGFHGSASTGGETPSSGTGHIISSHKRKQQKKRKKKGMKKLSIGSSSSSHSSSATTHISLSSLKESEHILKSPRFSPLPKYDRYYRGKTTSQSRFATQGEHGVPRSAVRSAKRKSVQKYQRTPGKCEGGVTSRVKFKWR